jgi:hypothetical protein
MFVIVMIIVGVFVFTDTISGIVTHLKEMRGINTFVKRPNSRHVVVCGNPQLSDLVRFTSEFYATNRVSNNSAKVVVMVEKQSWTDAEWLHSIARTDFLKKRLVSLTGSVRSTGDLERAQMSSADAVFMLSSPVNGLDPTTTDTASIMDILAIRNYRTDIPIYTTVLLKSSIAQVRVAQASPASVNDPELLFRGRMHGNSQYHGLRREMLIEAAHSIPKHLRDSAVERVATNQEKGELESGEILLGGVAHVMKSEHRGLSPAADSLGGERRAQGQRRQLQEKYIALLPQEGDDDLAASSAICLQDIHAAIMAAHVKANGVGTLATNMVLDINPQSVPGEPAWLSEYHLGAICNLTHLVIPAQLDAVRVDDIAVLLYDHGLVLMTTSEHPSGFDRKLVLNPSTKLRKGDVGMFLTYHRSRYACPALMLAALKYEADDCPFGEGHAFRVDETYTSGPDSTLGGQSTDKFKDASTGNDSQGEPQRKLSTYEDGTGPENDDPRNIAGGLGLNERDSSMGSEAKGGNENGAVVDTALHLDGEESLEPSPNRGECVSYSNDSALPLRAHAAVTSSLLHNGRGSAAHSNRSQLAPASAKPVVLPRNDAIAAACDLYSSGGDAKDTETDDCLSEPKHVPRRRRPLRDTRPERRPVQHSDGYIPDGIKHHIIVVIEGASALDNLALLAKYLWRSRKRTKRKYVKRHPNIPLVVVSPVMTDACRESFSQYEGKCIFFISDQPSSRVTWQRAKLSSANGVVMLADYALPLEQADARVIFTLMTLDTVIKADQNVFVVAELVDEKSLEFLREPTMPRRVGVALGDAFADGNMDLLENRAADNGSGAGVLRRNGYSEPTSSSSESALHKKMSQLAARVGRRVRVQVGDGNGHDVDPVVENQGDAALRQLPRGTCGDIRGARKARRGGGRDGKDPTNSGEIGFPSSQDLARSDVMRARRGVLLSGSRYASGDLLLPSASLTLLLREYLEPGFVQFCTELLGAGREFGSLKVRLVRIPSSLFESTASVSLVGSGRCVPYRELFVRLVRLGATPLGLYRSGAAPVRVPTRKRVHRGPDFEAECLRFVTNNACSLHRKAELEPKENVLRRALRFVLDTFRDVSPEAQVERMANDEWLLDGSSSGNADDFMDVGTSDALGESAAPNLSGGSRVRTAGFASSGPQSAATDAPPRRDSTSHERFECGNREAFGSSSPTREYSNIAHMDVGKRSKSPLGHRPSSTFANFWNVAAMASPMRRRTQNHTSIPDAFSESVLVGNKLPYVFTMPEPYTLVSERDGVYILCDGDFELPRCWAEGYAQDSMNNSYMARAT